jgi:hypothetical protein
LSRLRQPDRGARDDNGGGDDGQRHTPTRVDPSVTPSAPEQPITHLAATLLAPLTRATPEEAGIIPAIVTGVASLPPSGGCSVVERGRPLRLLGERARGDNRPRRYSPTQPARSTRSASLSAPDRPSSSTIVTISHSRSFWIPPRARIAGTACHGANGPDQRKRSSTRLSSTRGSMWPASPRSRHA